jgi:hypothetical protein
MITIQNLTFGGTFSYETPNLPPAPEYTLFQINQSSTTQIDTAIDWSSISGAPQFAGKFAGIKTNGTLWTWGTNVSGELGLGNTTEYNSPKQVGALTTWSKVSAGEAILAIKTDGTMWRFSTSPVQVGSANTWSTVSSNYQHYGAIKTDGTIWTWGNGADGRCGLNDTSGGAAPRQITYLPEGGSTTGWTAVSAGRQHTLAINNGYLFAFGYNTQGQLGNGTSGGSGSNKVYPVPIGGLNNWSQLSCGRDYCSYAVKTDGTMWSWGLNGYHTRLGLNDATNRSSPTQIGSLTNWLGVSAGGYYAAAIKTNGTMWAWGTNADGQLGDGTTIRRSSPVQVGGLSAWSAIASRYETILAIKTIIY